jgi:hypothetical protein
MLPLGPTVPIVARSHQAGRSTLSRLSLIKLAHTGDKVHQRLGGDSQSRGTEVVA